LAGLLALCIVMRRRYRVACFGLLTFLIWLAPTSSIVPLKDALAERRMYLPMIGLILIGCEVASRLRMQRTTGYAAILAILAVFAALCYQRNVLWSQPAQLWAQAAMQSSGKGSPFANLVDELVPE